MPDREDDSAADPARARERGDGVAEFFGSVVVTDADGNVVLVGPDPVRSPTGAAYARPETTVDPSTGEPLEVVGEATATGELYSPPAGEDIP